jgi:hypothetical protein
VDIVPDALDLGLQQAILLRSRFDQSFVLLLKFDLLLEELVRVFFCLDRRISRHIGASRFDISPQAYLLLSSDLLLDFVDLRLHLEGRIVR